MEHLYIIGNGFDLHHKYRSGFIDYAEWLMEHHPDIYYSLENWFDIPENEEGSINDWRNWWRTFEIRLGEVPIRPYIENVGREGFDIASQAEERKWYDIYSAERIADEELSLLISQIKGTFSEWIKTLVPGDGWHKLPMNTESAFFVNFNYTDTLERVYHIPEEQILHIHGALNSEEYILGHGLSYSEIEALVESKETSPAELSPEEEADWYSSHSDDFTTEQAKRVAIDRMMELKKDIRQIIHDNKKTFESFKGLSVVYVYGLSYSPVDMPYLYEIAAIIDLPTTIWELSYFSEEDKKNAMNFIESANIPKANVRFVRLSDIQIDYQLQLSFD